MIEPMPGDDDSTSRGRCATAYRLRIRGPVPASLLESFNGAIIRAGSTTALTCSIADASELYGLIARLEALGLMLVSVEPVDPFPKS
jgi:hypothetical protein